MSEQTWIQFHVTQNALGRYVIVMTEYSRDALGCTSTSTDIASLDTRYSSKQEAERRLVEIYEGLGRELPNPESETLKPDTKDPLWLISKDNPDRSYHLIRVTNDRPYLVVGSPTSSFTAEIATTNGAYRTWSGSDSTPERAMTVAIRAAELDRSLKAKYGH